MSAGGLRNFKVVSSRRTAGEGIAQAFHMETGTPTVSLRLGTTYGPGRDQGFTSAPTTALKAAAANRDYALPYHGREHYHYVRDVAAGFAEACLAPFDGLGVFNLRGETVTVAEFAAKVDARTEARVTIAADAVPIPFVSDLDSADTEAAFPGMPLTPLDEGIDQSLDVFRRA